MRAGALGAYERALESHTALWMWDEHGHASPLDIERWRGPADDTDLSVVRRARSPVLDVGCGPGRIVAAMSEHGHLALGIDVSPGAVSMTRSRGLNVVRRDVFDPLPGERRWRTIVVLDGSVGIGGDLPVLLRRLRQLLAADGELVIETHPDTERWETASVRLGTDRRPEGPSFRWAAVGADVLRTLAPTCGLAVVETWSRAGRTFVALERGVIPAADDARGSGRRADIEQVE